MRVSESPFSMDNLPVSEMSPMPQKPITAAIIQNKEWYIVGPIKLCSILLRMRIRISPLITSIQDMLEILASAIR